MSEFIFFDIIDIGTINRTCVSIETKNKECSVLSCRISGSTLLDTGTAVLNINPADILYIPKGANYSQKTFGEKVIYIHLEVLGNKNTEIQHLIFKEPDIIIDYFLQLAAIWKTKQKNYRYICTAMLYEMIAKTSIMLPETNKDLLYPALQYIKEHFCDSDFSLEYACKKSNICRSYFNRIFKERFGITPALYINQLKIEKAKFLLSCKAYTHNEVANMCGFNDTKYFYTVFKQITKTTAKKYQNAK